MSAPAATLSPAADPAMPGPHLPDFSERLSPMLVKELRQGLRSPVFVWGLIVMNLFLAVIVWLTMLDPDEETLHQAFFGAYCVLVCGLLPLRAAGALHDELRGHTIDTLILTKLTGWRITLGKWVAVVAQQFLAAVTVLPYLIVRYFGGGLDVPMELAWLGIFLLAGMGSAAVLTGFSWIRYFLFRAALMMGMTWLTGAFCLEVLAEMYGRNRDYLLEDMYQRVGWQGLALLLMPAMHGAFFALDLGASRVGSIVENRSVRRRIVGGAVILFYLGMAVLWGVPAGRFTGTAAFYLPMALAAVTLAVVGLQAILESPLDLVAVVMPMARRGWRGRLAGRFFYPGWPSGVCYTLLLLVVFAGVLLWWLQQWWDYSGSSGFTYGFYESSARDVATVVGGLGGVAGLLPVPLVIWQLFFRRRLPWHLWIYGLILAAVAAGELVVIAVATALDNQNLLKWGIAIPTMSWAWLQETDDRGWPAITPTGRHVYFDWDYGTITVISGIVIQLWWLAALLLAGRAFRTTRAVEREAAALLRPPPPPGP